MKNKVGLVLALMVVNLSVFGQKLICKKASKKFLTRCIDDFWATAIVECEAKKEWVNSISLLLSPVMVKGLILTSNFPCFKESNISANSNGTNSYSKSRSSATCFHSQTFIPSNNPSSLIIKGGAGVYPTLRVSIEICENCC